MPQPLNPFSIKNLGIFGVIRTNEVNDDLLPEQAVVEALNVHFDSKGVMTVRPGLTILGSQIGSGSATVGLFSASFNNTSAGTLLAAVSDGPNNDVYVYTEATNAWTKSKIDDTAGAKTRFVNFANRVIAVNGSNTLAFWAGTSDTTWVASGNPINAQQLSDSSIVPEVIETFKSKVYIAGNTANPDRLYYSSVISSAGNITWTPSVDFIDINPSDGENITALKKYSLTLLIFKPNYLYRYHGIEGLDAEPFDSIGTRSQESVVVAKNGCYFHHDTGFYKYAGGKPQEISKPISDIVDAIPKSNYTEISGWKDNDHVYWNIGDITASGVSFINVVVRYTISSEVWTIYSYPNELKFGGDYDNGTNILRVVGDETGRVYEFNAGTNDNGTSIGYRLITKWYEPAGIFNTKVLQDFAATCEKAQGMTLMYQKDDDPAFKEIGQLRKYLTIYKDKNIKFHRIKFKITGMSSNEAPIFKGIWALRGVIEGLLEI